MLASSLCTDVPSPSKKSGEETLLPIFSEGGGTSVHRAISNFRAPGERSFCFILPSENVHWKCTCAAYWCIIKIN